MNDGQLAAGCWRLARKVVGVFVAGLALASCGSLLETDLPAPTRYVMATPPPATSATSSAASQVDIAIGIPQVAPGLDSERIAVLRDQELDYYRGALWRGTLPDTVQSYLVTTLQQQQLFRSVSAEQARVGGEYALDIEVRDFQAEYADGAANPVAHITLVGRVIRVRDRKLLDTLTVSAAKATSDNRLTAVATAFEAAMQQVSLELASRAAAIVAADRG